MRTLALALLCLAACGAPCPADACIDTFEACADSAPSYEGMLTCRDSMNACLGRVATEGQADSCFAIMAACLQSDTIPRRACLQREADCLRTARCGGLP